MKNQTDETILRKVCEKRQHFASCALIGAKQLHKNP